MRNEVFRFYTPRLIQRPPFTNPELKSDFSESSVRVFLNHSLDSIVPLSEVIGNGTKMLEEANGRRLLMGTPEEQHEAAIRSWTAEFQRQKERQFEVESTSHNRERNDLSHRRCSRLSMGQLSQSSTKATSGTASQRSLQ